MDGVKPPVAGPKYLISIERLAVSVFEALTNLEIDNLANEMDLAVGKYSGLALFDPDNYILAVHTELYEIYSELRIKQLRRTAKEYGVI